MMKDFVNSRALPTIVSPQGGTSGSSVQAPSKISDDVARGGHASVKTSREEEQEEQTDDVATTAVVDDANPVRQEAGEVDDIKAINVDVAVEKLSSSQQKKKLKTAAKIAKKLKVLYLVG
jgi:hypothetical protein